MNNHFGAETQGRLHFSVALHEKSESPPGPSAPSAVDADLDFQVTEEKDCDGLKVLSWTKGVQGAVVHQLCRLRPLCKAAASESRRLGLGVGSRWEPQTLRLRVLVSDSELASELELPGRLGDSESAGESESIICIQVVQPKSSGQLDSESGRLDHKA